MLTMEEAARRAFNRLQHHRYQAIRPYAALLTGAGVPRAFNRGNYSAKPAENSALSAVGNPACTKQRLEDPDRRALKGSAAKRKSSAYSPFTEKIPDALRQ